ncbi:MAG: magnesium/cobalt transporter CorA [Deltaproteobacteria bacterium]|nr:magnesium/cobalt transporter CorA [Deltaproteobacteria bacterium]
MPKSKYAPKKIGLPPGSLVHVGRQKVPQALLSVIDFDSEKLEKRQGLSIEDCLQLKDSPTVSWINMDGIHDVSLVRKLGETFTIHELALEDILNTQHPPKFEEYESNLLFILKMLRFNPDNLNIEKEQVSLVVGNNYVITFQEEPGDVFDGVRKRLEKKSGRIRSRGADYISYALIDSIVDSYFFILDAINDQVTALEEELLDNPDRESLSRIHRFRNETLMLRKMVRPLREMLGSLLREEIDMIQPSTYPYLRDLYDHVIQIMETIETMRETLASLHDLYLSSVSHRMNEVMKILTVIATIFIPLTFIAGIYGMNFENMPELKWKWGYAGVWLVMLASFAGMMGFFKRKKWF